MKYPFLFLILFLINWNTVSAQQVSAGFRVKNPEVAAGISQMDILIQTGELKKAETLSESLLKKHPNNYQVIDYHLTILEKKNEDKKIITFLEKQISKHPRASTYYFKLAERLSDKGETNASNKILNRLLENYQYHHQASEEVFNFLFSRGETREALKVAAQVRKLRKAPDFLLFETINLHDLEGHWDEMLKEILVFFQYKKRNRYYYRQKKYIYDRLLEIAEEEPTLIDRFYNMVKEKKSKDFYVFTGELYAGSGRESKALELYFEADDKLNAKGGVAVQLAYFYLNRNQYNDAIKVIQSCENKYQGDYSFELAGAFKNMGKIDSAIHYYEIARKGKHHQQRKFNINMELAAIYLDNERNILKADTVVNELDTRRINGKQRKEFEFFKLKILLKKGRFTELRSQIDNILGKPNHLNINKGDLFYLYGKSLFYEKKYLNAAPYFQRVFSESPSAFYFNDLIHFHSIVQSLENDIEALNLFSEAEWAGETFRFEKAEKKYRQLTETAKSDGEIQKIYQNYLQVLLELNDREKIIMVANEGVSINPDGFSGLMISKLLADYYFDQSEHQKAYALYQKILKSENGIALKAEIRKKIEALRKTGNIAS